MIRQSAIVMALFSWLVSMPVTAAVIPPTAGPYSADFVTVEATLKDPDTGYTAVLNLKSRLTVGVLLGEPVYTCVASWELQSVTTNGHATKAGLTGSSKGVLTADQIPQSVLREIALYNVKLAYPLDPSLPLYVHQMLVCDAGIMKAEGAEQPSFNFPSSPSWGKLFWNDMAKESLDRREARDLYAGMLDAYEKVSPGKRWTSGNSRLQKGELNLWAIRNWLDGLARKEVARVEKQAAVYEQRKPVLMTRDERVSDDAFDQYMTMAYKQETARKTITEIDQRKSATPRRTGLDRQALMARLSNESCADREELLKHNGDWNAGAAMQAVMGGCPQRVAPPPAQGSGLKLTRTPRRN